MKKNFFKKLALVMALTLAVGSVPATNVEAAAAPKFKSAKATVKVGQTKNYGIANVSAWSVKKIVVGNKSVATVVKSGKTAKISGVAEGKTTVRADLMAYKTKRTMSVRIPVTVKAANITIKGEDAAFLTAVNTPYTLTAEGASNVTWSVAEEGATVVDGKFTATKAGEYTVTATAGTATATQKVTVKEVILKSVKQAKYNTLELVALGNTEKLKKDVDNIVVTDTKTNVVYNVKLANPKAADATKVTVVTYNDNGIVSGNECTVAYDGVKVSFTATDAKVADLGISRTEVVTGVATTVLAQLLDKNGTVIDEFELGTAAPVGAGKVAYVNYDMAANDGYVNDDLQLVLLSNGATATATVEYRTYDYDATTGEEIGALTKNFTITAVKDNTTVSNFSMTIENAATAFVNWNLPVAAHNTLMVNDEEDVLGAITEMKAFFNIVDSEGNDVTNSYNVVSSDKSMLLLATEAISKTNATQPNVMLGTEAIVVKGIKPGTAYINAVNKITGVIEYSFPVVIKAERTFAKLDMPSSLTVSSEAAVTENTVTTTVEGFDQYGDRRGLNDNNVIVKVSGVTAPAGVTPNWTKGATLTSGTDYTVTPNNDGTFDITFTHGDADVDVTYQLQVSVADNEGKYLSRGLTLKVVDTTNATRTYALKISDTTVDLAVPSAINVANGASAAKDVKIEVAVMAKGAVVEYLDPTTDFDTFDVLDPKGVALTSSIVTKNAADVTVDASTFTTPAITKNLVSGTYRVHAVTKAASTNNIVRTFDGRFTIKDTQAKATAFVNERVPIAATHVAGDIDATVAALFADTNIDDLITMYYDGVKVDSTTQYASISADVADGAYAIQNGRALYIGKLSIEVVTLGGIKVKTLVDINRTFTLQ